MLPNSLKLHMSRLFCPARSLWPAITQKVATGEPLFAGWAARRVLQGLRVLPSTRIGPREGAWLPTRSVWGAARAILEAGVFSSQLLRSGQWHSSAYELYVDLGREETRAGASLLIEASGED